MSWPAMLFVRDQYIPDTQAKLLLVNLAIRADDEHHKCWPSTKVMAKDTSIATRTLERVMRRLRSDFQHIVECETRNGSASVWRFKVPDEYIHNPRHHVAEAAETEPPPHGGGSGGGTSANRVAGQEEPLNNQVKQARANTLPRARGLAKGGMADALAKLKTTFLPRDRGTIELQIANRIGEGGFEVLMGLDPSRVDMLCALQRRGELHDRDIVALRPKPDDWKSRRDNWSRAASKLRDAAASIRETSSVSDDGREAWQQRRDDWSKAAQEFSDGVDRLSKSTEKPE